MLARRERKSISNNLRTAKYDSFMGIDISSSNDTILDINTPDCLNMLPNSKGDLHKRYGIKSLTEFVTEGAAPTHLWAYGDELVTVSYGGVYWSGDDFTTSFGEIVTRNHITAIEQNDKLYLFTGSSISGIAMFGLLVFDGVTLEPVEGYIPTAYIGSPASGGGTKLEELNRISMYSFQEFQKEAGDTSFQFFQTNLISGELYILSTVTGDWELKTPGTDYTYNAETGLFSVTATIPNSSDVDGNDTVRIKGKKNGGLSDTVTKCNIAVVYGGKTNVSVWCAGNRDYPNYDFHTGVNRLGEADITYFPISEFDVVGGDDQAISGYGKQNEQLIIFKYNYTTNKESTWVRESQITDDGILFYIQEVHSEKGCVSPSSVVLASNSIWGLGLSGYNKVKPREELSENSLEPQSNFINYNKNSFSDVVGLIDDIKKELSYSYNDFPDIPAIDFEGKLYISMIYSNTVWVCDYQNLQLDQSINAYVPQWYRLNNIAALCFTIKDGKLYFGTRGGAIATFKDDTDDEPFVDEQAGSIFWFHPYPEEYDFYWTTKLTNLGTIQYTEDVESFFLAIRGYAKTELNLYSRSNINELWELEDTFSMDSFVYSSIVYSNWIYGGSKFPKAYKSRVKIKNAEYVQFKIGGTTRYPATITSAEVNITEGKEV